MIPVIETARLRLRGPQPADLPHVIAFWASDRSRHMGGPRDRVRAHDDYMAGFGSWFLAGYGYWAIEARDDGRFIGTLGVAHPPHFPEPEMGWALLAGAEGRGFATEAGLAALGWCRANLTLASLVSYIDPDNRRSLRLAERLGARPDPGAVAEDAGDVVMRHMVGGVA
jgi:RimJ/RimL family protein N-acetyltransferase